MSMEKRVRPAWVVAFLFIAYAMTGACSHQSPPAALSIVALMNDPVALDRALARCNRQAAEPTEDAECRNVRVAIARLDEKRRGTINDDKRKAQEAQLKFEQERELLRQREERLREQQPNEKPKIDPYSMPFVPPESPGGQKAAPVSQPQPKPKTESGSPTQMAATAPAATPQ
jgi:hypothetical protein